MPTRHFYTNGKEDRKFYDDDIIPEGWYRGRTNSGKGTVGKIWINNGVERKYVDKDFDIPDGWVKCNLKFTDSHKQNLSKSLKGKTRTKAQCKRIRESHNTDEYKQRINATRKEIYGVENFFQNEKIREKAVKNAHSEKAIKKKIETTQQHFDVDYPMQSKQVMEKSKQTSLKHFGVEYPFQADEVKEKSKQTCLEKYGTEYASQSDITKKIRKTNIEKYGVDNPLKSEK